MRKCEFKLLSKTSGFEKALRALLEDIPGNEIAIPKEEYLPKDAIDKIAPEAAQRWKIMYAIEKSYCCTIRRLTANDDDLFQGIAAIRLENDSIRIETYHIYGNSMQPPIYTDLSSLYDFAGVYYFVLKWAKFDEPVVTGAADLSDKQHDLLEQFQAAAEKLNDAGVSLIWDDDDNSLRAVNRDAVRDGAFYRDEPGEELPEDAESLFSTPLERLDVEVTYMSSDLRLYYVPKG